MHNLSPKASKNLRRITVWLLLVATLLQTMSGVLAAVDISEFIFGPQVGTGTSSANGIGDFSSEAVIEQLKKDFMNSVNENLLKKMEDYELKGEVGVILTFSDDSLIETYQASSDYNKMTYSEFVNGSYAKRLANNIKKNQNKVLQGLLDAGIISSVVHTYNSILDGAFVRTTYEQLEDLCYFDGVVRVTVSNTYLPAAAVENPVNVYPTGIFNSGDVKYTGKGTLVAILDTGCDYTHSAFTTHDVQGYAYTRDDIAEKLQSLIAYSYDNTLEAREVYYGNVTKNKIAFGYDYADKDPDILPFTSSHGTHVAGIIGGYDDEIVGVALDAQFAIMKVFSDYKQGAEDGDIIAALEDSVKLGVDAINMSLGSSCGFAFEYEPDEQYKNDLYDRIEKAGISLIVAAGNDSSSGMGGEEGNTNKTDNPDSAVLGSPSSYNSSFSVASIQGNKENFMIANGDQVVFFTQSVNNNAKEYNFFEMLGINAENPVKELEYVTVPGNGYAVNYTGVDVKGKIALVRRGDITFEEKVRHAYEAGAIGVIIYNNVVGKIVMTIGNDPKIPVISIGKDEGDLMASQESGVITFDYTNEAGPFMSDFSSWGPTPSLNLKPEITAHGGNIHSAIVGGEYDDLSGTSMAAPNMCGITVLIRQYVMERYPDYSATEIRDLVNRLCMSTATIVNDKNGNPYSPRKQGAGIADIVKATTTPAYLYVEGINKTKLELGDDPNRKGVYTMTVCLANISNASVSYKIDNITMTESVSASEPEFVAEMAYLLSNTVEYKVEGGTFADGIVTVETGKTAKITVTIRLSDADKNYLNSTFENGMFVEGYLTFDNTDEKGVDLNAPFLAFYGNWAEAPIFDLDYYEVETEAHNNAIDDDDKIKADYYATTPLGTYYYDYLIPLGTYLYKMDESKYNPIPATREKAALSYFNNTISGIYGVFAGLLRGARELNITITDTATGNVVWTDTQYNCYKAHYAGIAYPYISRFNLPMADEETGRVFGVNNANYEVTMSAKLDWDGAGDNDSDTYSFSFTIDYEAPTITDATFRTEYDKSREENRYYVDIYVYDNHYAMSLRPVLVYDVVDGLGREKKNYSSLIDSPVPIYQQNAGEVTKVTLEITDYMDIIAESAIPEGLTIYVDDYATNAGVYFIPFPETDSVDLEFQTPEITLGKGQTMDLTTYMLHKDGSALVETAYLKSLKWTSSDESVVAISGGKIEAKGAGTAKITVTGDNWKIEDLKLSKTIVVTVTDDEVNDPNNGANALIESLQFVSYKTLFAFNGDIDPSAIGMTGMINYFGGSYNLECYPSEKVQLYYKLEPWNMNQDRYRYEWISSNPRVATVDEHGVVTAEAEGIARITLRIYIDGKASLLTARCTFEVKSEYVIENRKLVAYKGKGGDVVIPDDEGIMYIGAFAFSHYNMDNEKYVEKDEDGYYDIDLKKSPIGNKTVTSVVVPEDVETIEKFAFYNCEILKSVTLPESCETIEISAFQNCKVLTDINLDYVNVISNDAFNGCESLTCNELGGINLSGVYAIGSNAFKGTRISYVSLDTLSLVWEGAFSDCAYLTTAILGEKTRVSKNMFKNSGLTSVTVYGDSIGDGAFEGCKSLTTVNLDGDLTYLGAQAFKGCTALTTVNFNAGCEVIGAEAFSGCSALRTFKLPNCAVSLGGGVFYECKKFQTLVLDTDTVLADGGHSWFYGLDSYTIDVSASNNYEMGANGAIYSEDGTVLVAVIPSSANTKFTVGKDVKKIASSAFAGNKYIEELSFEEGSKLTTIGSGAFANCINLKKVTLPENAIVLEDSAFMNATSLATINLENVSSFGTYSMAATAITTANLTYDGVVIKGEAFGACPKLKTVVLGNNADIGDIAFALSTVTTVDIQGSGVTVGTRAFLGCQNLSSFDFEGVTGKIGDMAFYYCTALTTVIAPNVTEIGNGAFADCYNLTTVSAKNVTKIGGNAFGAYSEESTSGAAFTTVDLPALTEVGPYAFLLCKNLTTIDLSNVTTLGEAAFARCGELTSVTISNKLTELPDYAFIECVKLVFTDLSGIVTFGNFSLLGVTVPAELKLDSAVYVGDQVFAEFIEDKGNTIVSVEAPNLTYVGNQAFAGCKLLTSFYAPSLETVKSYAFALTAIEYFQITENLKEVENGAFQEIASFKGFYATVNGEETDTVKFTNVVIDGGVLYSVVPKGYVLICYPADKEADEYTVIDGTVRIDFAAAYGNKNLKKVIMPESLRYIGDFAFFACESLETVVFNSYYAPVLEGSMVGEAIDITPENVKDYPGFDELYGYDYYYHISPEKIVARAYYYRNFKDTVGSVKAQGMTYILPTESKGYDSKIYSVFFTASDENSGTATGPYAIAFINAVNKLTDDVDRFDRINVEAAINAFNALENKPEELAQVDAEIIARFEALTVKFHVDVVEDLINHLFDMYNSEHSFNSLKEARAAYLALTDAERALVSNGSVIEEKITQLTAAMGKTPDFELTYEDHFPDEPGTGDEPGTEPGTGEPEPSNAGIIVLIVVISVLVVGGAAAGVVIFLKKKKENK